MPRVDHCGVTQGGSPALETPRAPPVHPSLPPDLSVHGAFHCRRLCRFRHVAACGLFRLAAFTRRYAFAFPPWLFYGLMARFFSALNNIPWSGWTTVCFPITYRRTSWFAKSQSVFSFLYYTPSPRTQRTYAFCLQFQGKVSENNDK